MMITTVDAVFGRDARSVLPRTRREGPDGGVRRRERGGFTVGTTTVDLSIRTRRVFAHQAGIGWRQVHHQAVASAAATGR
ncbi:hypothetical protein QLQ12_34245 [Actinoplanes sp. NEAU-A12]|uniref:Transposase n=1 Tax=Actinoplanes sandaracinus TaxID=3045177 RepID=A0ABT6WVB4_9ACTN|nr:hypothetical protein [Actinoplanes sandaracinus]MDI6103687.1 hypothetical protein [Actinoplanes sandaracinus]